MFCLKWDTIHNSTSLQVFNSNEGRWWPDLIVFNLSGINKIALSSNTFKHSGLRNLIVWSRCPVVRHNNIASLCDAALRSQFTNACCFLRYWKTLLTFQVVTYRGKAGLILKTPLKNLLTKGSFPKGMPWSGFIREDNADLAEFTAL